MILGEMLESRTIQAFLSNSVVLTGLTVALLVAIVLAIPGIADNDLPDRHKELVLGRVEDFRLNYPGSVVRLDPGIDGAVEGMVAFSDRDPATACGVYWDAEFVYMGRQGWFKDGCHTSVYDLAGRCFGGPCPRGLDRYKVEINDNGNVVVKRTDVINGPIGPAPPGATPYPVNLP